MARITDNLCVRLSAGDTSALEQLYRQSYSRLCGLACQMLHSRESAEEVVDDVFAVMWRNRAQMGGVANIDSYLYTATRNSCLNELNSRSHRQAGDTCSVDDDLDAGILAEAFRDERDAADELYYKELCEQIEDIVAEMPAKMRDVFLQSRREGLTMDEIAVRNQISVNTVHYHLKEALARLRKAIGTTF